MENNSLNNLPAEDEENGLSLSFYMNEILKKYNLYEVDDRGFEKWKDDKPSNGEIVRQLTKNLFEKKIEEKYFYSSLQNNFGMSLDMAKKMLTDIETNILSRMEKNKEKRERKQSTTKIETKIISPIATAINSVDTNPIETKKIESPKIPKLPKKAAEILPGRTASAQKAGPDSYREPME